MENTPKDNELFEKHVYADAPVKPSEQSFEVVSFPDDGEPIAFDKPTVLDEGFAQRKAEEPAVSIPEPRPARRMPAKAPVRRTAPRRRTSDRLCSGETVSDAARRITRELCALLAFILLVFGGFRVKNAVSDLLTDNSVESLYTSSTYSSSVHSTVSPADGTLPDGYSAAQAVCTKLKSPITDTSLFTKTAEETIFPNEVVSCMESALTDSEVILKNDLSNRELLMQIHESLDADKPVIVLLTNGIALKYAVVTGMDAELDEITVQSPGVGEARYSFEDFLAATRFETLEDMPFATKLGLTFGSLSKNTAIFVK